MCGTARTLDALTLVWITNLSDCQSGIGDAALPARFAPWFAAPWRTIYALNVDDLEVAVQQQFALPRRLVPTIDTAPRAAETPPGDAALGVVHLNGLASHLAVTIRRSHVHESMRAVRARGVNSSSR